MHELCMQSTKQASKISIEPDYIRHCYVWKLHPLKQCCVSYIKLAY